MSKSLFAQDLVRFLIAGAINTASTAAIYFILLIYVLPEIAYTISWLVGLIFVAVVYPKKVFLGGTKTFRNRAYLAVSTALVFFSGLWMLNYLRHVFQGHELAFLITLVFTTTVNFIVGRLIVRRGGR